MLEKELETKEASDAVAAIFDAARRNRENIGNWSSQARDAATVVRNMLLEAYNSFGVYINYRQKFISVKIDHPSKRSPDLIDQFNQFVETQGYEKAITAQGFLIRITKDPVTA